MSTLRQFLDALTRGLDDCGIPYMICGSLASSIRGEPRSTNDVDVVISPTSPQLEQLLSSLPNDWYFDRQTARVALRTRDMFNVIDPASGWKADLIIIKNRPFSRSEFERRANADWEGLSLSTASAEDVILSKLEWMGNSESERQYRDVLRVATMHVNRLDRAYLGEWAEKLRIEHLLARLLDDLDRLEL